MTALLSVENLSIEVGAEEGPREAVSGLDLSVRKGEIVGVVGESGAGKSLTALAIAGLLPPDVRVSTGRILFDGVDLLDRNAAETAGIRGRRIGMIFQEPTSALNPSLTIGYQISEPLRLHRGMDRASAQVEAARLLDRVAIGGGLERLGDYPHQLSGGQRQRVMIAMALAGQPDLLLADEPTTALDVTVQAGILDLLSTLREELQLAVLFISHDLAVIAQLCDRMAVLYAGREVETGRVDRVVRAPAHPYSRALIGAVATESGHGRLQGLGGRMPEPGTHFPGCPFEPRCSEALEICAETEPRRELVAEGHVARCLLHASEGDGGAPS